MRNFYDDSLRAASYDAVDLFPRRQSRYGSRRTRRLFHHLERIQERWVGVLWLCDLPPARDDDSLIHSLICSNAIEVREQQRRAGNPGSSPGVVRGFEAIAHRALAALAAGGFVRPPLCAVAAAVFILGGGAPAIAETGLTIRVVRSGAPISGATVTARAIDTGIETTVFSADDGGARIEGLPSGPYRIGARTPGAAATSQDVSLEAGAAVSLSFEVREDEEYLKRVPSADWLNLLPDGEMKREFVLNCGSCHEIGHGRVIRGERPRSAADWRSAIALMRSIDAYGLTPPDFDDEGYADWLALHLNEEAIGRLRPPPPAEGAALRARITEYPVPKTPSLPHDLIVGPKGRVWITAFYNNVLWALDPQTGKTQDFPVNAAPDVMGQVRALTFGPDGKLWTLLGGTESLVRLDPEDGSFETFPVGMYPHSIEIDSTGKIWFNDYLSAAKRIGSMNPATGEVKRVSIPGAVLTPEEGLPLLYGLQIDRRDVMWGTMLAANKLFRFDIATAETELFEMPTANSGPRRPGVAPDGAIWIPEFNTGTLTRFDPTTRRFDRFALGSPTLGPYDVAVDQSSGHVWVAAALGSALIRYDPKTDRRDVYPLPTEPAYPRHIAIDPKTGDVWTTYSSMPDATPKIVRIELGPNP